MRRGRASGKRALTNKGAPTSRRISECYHDATSDGGPFAPVSKETADPRATSLKAQLDELVLLCDGKPNRLVTLEEALRVQILVEGILVGQT